MHNVALAKRDGMMCTRKQEEESDFEVQSEECHGHAVNRENIAGSRGSQNNPRQPSAA